MIFNGLYKLLTTTDPVKSLLGKPDAVYQSRMPRDASQQCVVIHEVVDDPIVCLDGTAKLTGKRMQFDCYSGVAGNDKKLSAAVRNLLPDLCENGPVTLTDSDATVVQSCVLNGEWDGNFEQGGDDAVYRSIVDITVWYITP